MSDNDNHVPPSAFFGLGLVCALIVLLADQASKLGLLYGTDLRLTYPWTVLPFIDITVVWNKGISYGLFQQDGDTGRWILTGVKIVAAIVLTVWLRKAADRVEAVGIGLIIGGAVGNAIDRVAHKAVFDFIHLRVGTFSWYVFNVADAAIVIGVIAMVASPLIAQLGARSAKV
ncbi:LspA Lipoprotein signal peptidase [Rhabdaerophilaceae bacterium]